MSATFPDGTRVRFTKKYARTRTTSRTSINWAKRCGTVQHTTKLGYVLVLWDGNKAVDSNDKRVLEKVE